MPTSVMPKGVEHAAAGKAGLMDELMPTSVMPKGVEHVRQEVGVVGDHAMPTSVMPKGVEHEPKPLSAVCTALRGQTYLLFIARDWKRRTGHAKSSLWRVPGTPLSIPGSGR